MEEDDCRSHADNVENVNTALNGAMASIDPSSSVNTKTINNESSTAVSAAPAVSAPVASAAAAASTAAGAGSKSIDAHLAQTLQAIETLTNVFSFPPHVASLAVEECGPDDVQTCYNWILDNCSGVEDKGGPIVPKMDCPHVARHVKLNVVEGEQGKKFVIRCGNGTSNGTSNAISEAELERWNGDLDIVQGECQHYATMRRRASRKRFRSDDGFHGGVGRLKCEEDYTVDCSDDAIGRRKEDRDQDDSEMKSLACPKGENWLCLQCGVMLCSRYANGHAKMHWEDSKQEESLVLHSKSTENSALTQSIDGDGEGHCIAVSLADLSVWCYVCNSYLQHPSLDALTRQLEDLKFGADKSETGSDNFVTESNDTNVNKNLITQNAVENGKQRLTTAATANTTIANTDIANNDSSNSREVTTQQHPNQNENDSDDESSERHYGGGKPIASLLSGQIGTSIRSYSRNDHNSDASSDENSSNNSNDSDAHDSDDETALLSSLLQTEHAAAIRAYLSQHPSLSIGDQSRYFLNSMPKPPSFPSEMADFLRSPMCRSIVVLAGAGMSVSSGIPDFRSAGVGLYDTLRPELLTASELEQELIRDDPTLALDKGMFLRNPLPCLELKRSFILGTYESRWKATLAHRFVELLHSKLGKLTRLYTQNIDGLELQCKQLPMEKVINVHGSMGRAACEVCGASVDFDTFCSNIRTSIKDITGEDPNAPETSTPIRCQECDNPTVKPTIVLFRGSMPNEFHAGVAQDLPDCDLLIVMGTSLMVAPANTIVFRVPPTTVRMVMNNEPVGRRLGIMYGEQSVRDVFAHGHSDETCLRLAEEMGWLDDLEKIMDELPKSSAQMLQERLSRRQTEE